MNKIVFCVRVYSTVTDFARFVPLNEGNGMALVISMKIHVYICLRHQPGMQHEYQSIYMCYTKSEW